MPTMTTDGPMRIPLTTTEMQDVLITLTTGFGLVASGQVEQISPLHQVSIIGFLTSIDKEPHINRGWGP